MMHKALYSRDGVHRLYLSRKDSSIFKIALMHQYSHSKITLKNAEKDGDQKQNRQDKHQQNKNNQITKQNKKMGRKTTVWTFQATNKRYLTRYG